jgi:hypothetical protein
MAHYAFLDENNIVTEVIVGKNEGEDGVDWERIMALSEGRLASAPHTTLTAAFTLTAAHPFARTTLGWVIPTIPTLMLLCLPNPLRLGYLTKKHALWEAPVAMPEDAGTGEPPKRYSWDEATTSWVEQGA